MASAAARKAPKLGGGTVALDAAAFESRFNMPLVHEAVRAELNAPRQGPASSNERGGQRGAPEGDGPRPRGVLALAGLDRRRRRVRADAAPLHLQGQSQGAS